MRITPSQAWATLFTIGVFAAVGCTGSGDDGPSGTGDSPVPAGDTSAPAPNLQRPAPRSVEMTPPPVVDTPRTLPPQIDKPDEPAARVAALERVSSCDEAASFIRKRAIASMNAAIDARKKNLQNNTFCFAASAGMAQFSPSAPAPPPAQTDSTSSGGANATSMTNNQVAGVDEADFIKNDPKYVYAAVNGALRIVQAWPAAETREVANVQLEGTPKKLFVLEDRALVYVSVPRTAASDVQPAAGSVFYAGQSECTYGYDCQFGGDGTGTALLVFDITDRAAPKQIRRIDLSGSLLAARRIGSAVHTVAVTPELTFPGVTLSIAADSTCSQLTQTPERDAQYEALRKKNTEIIETAALSDFLPSVRDNGVDYAQDNCDSLYRELEPTGTAFTTLVSVDMAAASEPVVATVLSKPGAVYASGEALYMSVIADEAQPIAAALPAGGVVIAPPPAERKLVSAIHKFSIGADPKATAYLASGKVKGHVLNQFSMDEHGGHLRVATSWGKVPSPDVHSTMSVLAQHEDKLTVVGIVDKIAPNEDIRSVRFDADRGFIVTFKKTDPLYAFDLSAPAAPKIAGELKIPGFSTYMHMLDDDHLLTIGYDAADQGDFAYFTGVLLQIFDVSDPANLSLAHKVVIGSRGSSSEALTNHLAFTLFQGKLALPMTICEGGDTNGQYGTNMTFSGLLVFDVSVADGLRERGRVAHPNTVGQYDNSGCSNWWTRASSVVQRSVFMDDFVYSIAQDVIRVQNLDKLGTDVASVALKP